MALCKSVIIDIDILLISVLESSTTELPVLSGEQSNISIKRKLYVQYRLLG